MPQTGWTYPHFVGEGYTSCLTCHYNPFGNGPLNDYGRALSATAISSRSFYDDKVSEEKIASRSGFLFTVPKQTHFRMASDYRGLFLKRNIGTGQEQNDWINMDLNASAVFKFGPKEKFTLSASLSYVPVPRALESQSGADQEDVLNYRTREHYIGYRHSNSFGVYAGLMDKVYGIRIAEHTAYSRSVTGLDQNDQSHGIQFHYAQKNWEVGVNYFIGNLVQDEALRQVGGSLKVDYVLPHKGTIGASLLKSSNEFAEEYMTAFHYVGTAGKGSSVLFEVGQKSSTGIEEGSRELKDTYGLAQGYFKLDRGVYFINTLEYLKDTSGDKRIRIGPGLQLFPIQRVEFRIDLQNTRNLSSQSATKDVWDLLAQVHTWF
jgi:hypothetical protein